MASNYGTVLCSSSSIVNLHYMLSKAVVKSRPTVLWCYKDKLELSSHKKKRAKQIKKLMQRGLLDPEKVDPFSLFVETGGLTYCLYKDSERILGNTFGMCILQDFEALTPNLLARTIETVEGGGLIVLLLRSLSSLTSLYTMVMRMMALYVASHYKNSPNDLQLMADAPAHHLFVLLGPVDESENKLPDILCVIQISRKSAVKSLSDGHQPFGDQIPWKFCEQFWDTVFPSLSGACIVRIATHPSAMKLGYGSAAMELLTRYYEGQFTPISEVDFETNVDSPQTRVTEAAEKVSLLEENIKPRTDLPHLLVHLHERRPEKLHYLGVSFGLTLDLFRFWRKHKFAPFYIGQIPSTVTGKHTCMVLKPLNSDDIEVSGSDNWGFFGPFYQDFRLRFARLLESSFRTMEYKLAMRCRNCIIHPKGFLRSLRFDLSPYDMERLRVYTENLADFHLILDIVQILARLYFQGKLPITMSYVQASVLLCIGFQHQNITYMERVLEPHNISVEDDLNEAAKQVEDGMKTKMEGMLNPELLQQYAIVDREGDFENALKNGGKITSGGLISVKSSRTRVEKMESMMVTRMGKSGKGITAPNQIKRANLNQQS
ncbi:hypothetical protein GH714_020215 [Hevea brasiliensis]|uniref:RNA cytidine acetyltransferase n=1 Tax=Hevea brasiliensis TaxID=3981 RepID=A0A6A6K656_HEVBR|nr:hypothetical protein GH714_020215 [Hevea brasiliensis]